MKREDLRLIRWVVNEVEWYGVPEGDDGSNHDYCPLCRNHRNEGHEEDCKMALAISLLAVLK